MTDRHSWSDKYRTEHKSERRCWRCGLLETTHHDGPGFPWRHYTRDGVKVADGPHVPTCQPQQVTA